MSTRAVVLADTHLRTGGRRALPEPVHRALDTADVILHAGDVLDEGVLAALRSFAPVHAVLGNNDTALAGLLPPTLVVELAEVRVAMIHDSGPRVGRAGRLHRRFPDAGVVVFGHSHIPVDEEGVAGQRLFNPGSPTERRTSPHRSIGVLEFSRGELVDHRLVSVEG